jgi:hypothetical protein
MKHEKNRLYNYILILSVIAIFGFVLLNIYETQKGNDAEICLLKKATGYPCPTCGTTRSVNTLLQGNITGSVLLNPFGIIACLLLTVLPCWILADRYRHKDSFFRFYKRTEKILYKPLSLLILILLMASNWAWNIYKGL